MTDWFRSIAVLGAAFAAVVIVTFGLATIIVPDNAGVSRAGGGSPSGSVDEPVETLPPVEVGLGGALAVTGDSEGIFRLASEDTFFQGNFYSLVGDEGRIVFEGPPVEITQISFAGLEFFPEPEACSLTPGELDSTIGIGMTEIRCAGLTDIRDTGTINLEGTIGLPLNMVGESGLPEQGGSVEVGSETWQFAEAVLLEFGFSPFGTSEEFNMQLVDEQSRGVIRFNYGFETHRLTLADVEHDGEHAGVPASACQLSEEELGKLNPRTIVIRLGIQCVAVEVPGLGSVPVTGTVIIWQALFEN
jgi:hypothetical protein